ncbi:ComEC/Rec2 family competence protein [Soonwooa purpurea]
MSRQPLFVMLSTFCLGIILRDYVDLYFGFILFLFLYCNLIVGFSFKVKSYFFVKKRQWLLGFAFFCLGFLFHDFNIKDFEKINFDTKKHIVFKIDKKLNSNEKYKKYQIDVLSVSNNKDTQFKAVLQIPRQKADLDFRHIYKSEVYFSSLKSPKFAFQFDYPKYLERQKVSALAFANSEILRTLKPQISFKDQIKQLRLETLQRIGQSNLQTKNQEFLKGIILADRTGMDDVTVSDFNRSGLVHLLAISGSHMLIIFWLVLLVLNKTFPVKYRKIGVVTALVAIWTFAIFIDYGSSVVRSCIMISVYYITGLLNRKPHLLQSLAVSAFLILCWDTQQLFDVGFQLSYVAVLGIFWLYQPILKSFPKKNYKIYKFIVAIFSLSMSAQLATLPLVLYYFHQYSLVSIFANLCVIPFSEIIIVFSLLMVLLFAFNLEYSWLNILYDTFVDILLKFIHWFATLDFLMFENIGFSLLEVVLALIVVYFLRFVLIKRDLRHLLNFGFTILLFWLINLGVNFYHFKKDEVLKIELFKNNIVLIKEKSNVLVLLKEGSDIDSVKKFLVNPYLSFRRIKECKIIMISEAVSGINYQGKYYKIDP